jgi:hypothetical protein
VTAGTDIAVSLAEWKLERNRSVVLGVSISGVLKVARIIETTSGPIDSVTVA